MGTLNYGAWSIEFEDRLLTHLQIVIITRFRRGESFVMSWIDSTAIGSGRNSIWLSPAVPAYFKFNGSRLPSIDEDWVRRLDASAASSAGLVVTDEHGTPTRVGASAAPRRVPHPTSRLSSAR